MAVIWNIILVLRNNFRNVGGRRLVCPSVGFVSENLFENCYNKLWPPVFFTGGFFYLSLTPLFELSIFLFMTIKILKIVILCFLILVSANLAYGSTINLLTDIKMDPSRTCSSRYSLALSINGWNACGVVLYIISISPLKRGLLSHPMETCGQYGIPRLFPHSGHCSIASMPQST